MGSIWFSFGLFFLSIGAFLWVWLAQQPQRVTPVAIDSSSDLHAVLRALLAAGADRETLFVVWFPTRFEVRVRRSARATGSTLAVEFLGTGSNEPHYAGARAALESEGLDFAEESPRRLHLCWPEGGPFVVSAVAHVLRVIEASLPTAPERRCAAACGAPASWRSKATPLDA